MFDKPVDRGGLSFGTVQEVFHKDMETGTSPVNIKIRDQTSVPWSGEGVGCRLAKSRALVSTA
jgi:hypothetical protein